LVGCGVRRKKTARAWGNAATRRTHRTSTVRRREQRPRATTDWKAWEYSAACAWVVAVVEESVS
jgi:hypothetical protein